MRHRKNSFKIGKSSAHRKALLANQTCSLIFSGEIRTTIPKAKQTKRIAEKMVTLAKKGTLHCRRRAISKLHDKEAVKILFGEIAENYKDRSGGYTRIIRLGQRKGDAADMCILQWVEAGSAAPAKEAPKAIDEKKPEAKIEENIQTPKKEAVPAEKESEKVEEVKVSDEKKSEPEAKK